MRPKKPYVATIDQVMITRDGDDAIIEYMELNVRTVHLKIGPEMEQRTEFSKAYSPVPTAELCSRTEPARMRDRYGS